MGKIREIIDNLNTEQIKEIENIYLNGTRKDVAEYLNMNYNSVGHILKHLGLYKENKKEEKQTLYRRQTARWNIEKIKIMDDNLAYLIGFIVGDGCIRTRVGKSQISLNIWSKDTQILNDIAHYIEYTIPIKNSIDIDDTEFSNIIKSYGVREKKSELGCTVKIPEIFYGSYLRGLLDSDGTVYFSNGKTPAIRFYGHLTVMEQVSNMLEFLKIDYRGPNKVRSENNLHYIGISKFREAEKLRDLMYKKDCLCLKRKKDRLYGKDMVRHSE